MLCPIVILEFIKRGKGILGLFFSMLDHSLLTSMACYDCIMAVLAEQGDGGVATIVLNSFHTSFRFISCTEYLMRAVLM